MIEAAELKADIYPAGPRGLSAYEIYKKEGGQLSEEEWLKSLNGLTPTIGENGNWFLGTVDTGLPSRGPKGDTGSIKFIVVTELPTENIDETAIYLKPVESPTGENNFEELIYVNGKWEDLGTPNVAVDLSNYYTKEESNEKLLAKQDKLVAGDNITISEGNVISAKGGESIYEVRPKDLHLIDYMDKALVGEQITRMFTDGVEDPILRVRPTDVARANITYYDFKLGRTDYPFSKKTQYNFMINPIISISGAPIQVWNTYLKIAYIYISGSWDSDNKFTCNTIRCNTMFNETVENITTDNKVLTKTNTTAFTPTENYHPATKKYVDDKTGELTNLSTEDKSNLVNAINEVANSNDGKLLTLNMSIEAGINIYSGEPIEKCSELINNLYKIGESTACILFYNQKYATMIRKNCLMSLYQDASKQNNRYYFNGLINATGNGHDTVIQGMELTIEGTWDNNIFTANRVSLINDRESISMYNINAKFLSKTNTSEYTPTADYNPATKKYVDDAIASAITTSLEASY